MQMSREQYESDEIQELINDIKSGKGQRELERDNENKKRVNHITMTYWTDAKIKKP
jgi:hypothetical protein